MLRYSLIYKKRERERAGAGENEWETFSTTSANSATQSGGLAYSLHQQQRKQTKRFITQKKFKLKKKTPTKNWINSPFPKTQTKNIMTRDMQ